MVFGVLVFLAILAGVILGWVSFFMVVNLRARHARAFSRLQAVEKLVADLTPESYSAKTPQRSSETDVPDKLDVPSKEPAAPLLSAVEKAPQKNADDLASNDAEATASDDAEISTHVEEESPYTRPLRESYRKDTPSGEGLPSRLKRFEEIFVANWLVWLGGVTLLLGGIFFVQQAIEEGWFGPVLRIISAILAGALMIGLSEYLLRRWQHGSYGQIKYLPLILASAGVIVWHGAIFAATALYELIPAYVAIVGHLLVASSGVILSYRHGILMGLIALIGAFSAPLMTGGGEGDPVTLLGYALGVSLASLALIHLRRWTRLIWVSFIGASFWGVVAGLGLLWKPYAQEALTLYAFILPLLAIAFAWRDSDAQIDTGLKPLAWLRHGLSGGETVFVSYLMTALGAILLMVAVWSEGTLASPMLIAGLFLLSILTLAASAFRASLVLMPLISAIATILALYFGTDFMRFSPSEEASNNSANLENYFWICISFSALFAIGGGIASTRQKLKAPLALVSAFVPIAFLMLGYYAGNLAGMSDWLFALAGLIMASGFAMGVSRIIGDARLMREHPSLLAIFTLATTTLLSFIAIVILERFSLTVALSLQLPVLGLLDRRFNLPALRFATIVMTLAIITRLVWIPDIATYEIGRWPVLNWLLYGYGLPIIAMTYAASFFKPFGSTLHKLNVSQKMTIDMLRGGAMVIGVLFITLQIRHLANHGDMAADGSLALEMGSFISAMAALSLMHGRLPHSNDFGFAPVHTFMRFVYFALPCLIMFLGMWPLGFQTIIEPSESWEPLSANGGPILNELMVAYGLPCIIFGLHAALSRYHDGKIKSRIALIGALVSGFIYLTLETARLFRGADLLPGPSDGEITSYTFTWIIMAGVLLMIGLWRDRASLRYASLGLLIISIMKAFFFDLAALEGAYRALSFIGLGIALILTALLYQRFVFAKTKTE